jgi:O-antigen/teichoic acid export membrane protein
VNGGGDRGGFANDWSLIYRPMTEAGAVLVKEGAGRATSAFDIKARDLKRSTTRGAFVSLGGQAATFVLRTGSMVIMARLLTPKDFGLVGMVAAVTGFLGLFRDLGLSMATVQRASITNAQTSTLFWINVAAGGLLTLTCGLLAPAIVAFYGEPRLFWVTVALGMSFLFNGAAAQHRAILQRSMRFLALAVIDIVSIVVSLAVGIGMALAGTGYWALVAAAVSQQVVSVVGVWSASRWIPGRPQRRSGVRSMLMYGGTVTLNNIVVYLAGNADKVLLGRFWGAETLGIYGRAYQLISLPTDNLNATIGQVAFPALSRVQSDPVKLRSYFLKGYSVFLSMVLPITMACALFAQDIILVFLGAKWHEAAGIFRLLAPTILGFALVNPFGWLLQATGQVGRSLRIALVITPVMILGYILGLGKGAEGVATAFSISVTAAVVPAILWAKRGTLISAGDVFRAMMRPAFSIIVASGAALASRGLLNRLEPVFARLVVENGVLFGVYLLVLLFGLNQKTLYMGLLREMNCWPLGTQRAEPESRGKDL